MSTNPHNTVLKCSNELMDEGLDPLEVAAAHFAHAMTIYRTVLPQDEYDDLIKAIYNTRNDVKPLSPLRMH